MKTINGLVTPDAGEARIDGAPISGRPPHLLRREIGYVFQEVGLFPHLSVAENIGVTPRLIGWPKARIAARVDELLDLVGLPRTFAPRAPAAPVRRPAPAGRRRRALAAGPKIMLMDEPFGALDPMTRDALGAEYRRLHEQLGLTTVMVTHDVAEAVLLADRIVVMDEGRIRADGAPGALLTHPDPAVCELLETPRRHAERVRARLEPTHG